MILIDKHEDLNSSLLSLSCKILKYMKKHKVLHFGEIHLLIEKDFEKKSFNEDKFLWALIFLYTFWKIDYNPKIDLFILK